MQFSQWIDVLIAITIKKHTHTHKQLGIHGEFSDEIRFFFNFVIAAKNVYHISKELDKQI